MTKLKTTGEMNVEDMNEYWMRPTTIGDIDYEELHRYYLNLLKISGIIPSSAFKEKLRPHIKNWRKKIGVSK